jgi:hypothetical protein
VNVRVEEEGQFFYVLVLLTKNILWPATKIQCDSCRRDISRCVKVLAEEQDYCCACFASLADFPQHYRIISTLDYPLFRSNWTAHQEICLLDGIEK